MKRLYVQLVLWLLAPALQLREEQLSMRLDVILGAVDEHLADSIRAGRGEVARTLQSVYVSSRAQTRSVPGQAPSLSERLNKLIAESQGLHRVVNGPPTNPRP